MQEDLEKPNPFRILSPYTKEIVMAKVTLQIPDNIPPINREARRRMERAILPELAESMAVGVCEKRFNVKFKQAKYNQNGFDITSECGKYKIEVKQTSCLGTKSDLSVGSTWSKKGHCTHIMIFDFYNAYRVSIIPENEFFNSNFHGKNKLWRWNKNYNRNNQPINTNLFLKYEYNENTQKA